MKCSLQRRHHSHRRVVRTGYPLARPPLLLRPFWRRAVSPVRLGNNRAAGPTRKRWRSTTPSRPAGSRLDQLNEAIQQDRRERNVQERPLTVGGIVGVVEAVEAAV